MKKLFVSAIALCMGFASFAQEAVAFKLNPELGKTQSSKLLMKTDIDSPQPVIMDMNMNTSTVASEIKDGNIVFELSINTVKMDMQSGMETINYDSEQPASGETAQLIDQQFRPLIGQKITSLITPEGKLEDIQLPEIAGNSLNANSFANQFIEFPNHAVKPGESWTTTSDSEGNPVFSTVELTNTYKEKTEEGYVITYLGTMRNEAGEEVGTLEGEYLIDAKTCMPISSKAVTVIEMMGAKITSTIAVSPN